MDLIKLENTIPIKAIPEAELNKIILMDFTPWVASLLSLTGEVSKDRLKVALPAIKKHCWSMGFKEIKKMFEMFADGELSIQPKSNYFDRILLSQIVNAYKMTQRTRTKPKQIEVPEISEAEKEMLFIQSVINCFESYKYDKTMTTGFTAIYQHFYEKDKFPKHDAKFREQVRSRAIVRLKTTATTGLISKAVKNYSEERISMMCKELILGDWFDTVTNIEKEI